MNNRLLCVLITSVIPVYSFGKHLPTEEDLSSIIEESSHLNIQSILTPTAEPDHSRDLSLQSTSTHVADGDSRNHRGVEGQSILGILLPLSMITKLHAKSIENTPALENSRNTQDGRLHLKGMYFVDDKQILDHLDKEELAVLSGLEMNKRFVGNFRQDFDRNVQNWFSRRYRYFDSLASSILRKRGE